jgi:hypothetical protein
MTAMVQLSSMFQHGNSVGAAFALLALGAGANLGLIAWMMRGYGVRRTAAWFGILIAVVVGLAYGVDKPLYPRGVEPAGHTHAFDGYCCPFHADEDHALRKALELLAEKTALHERQALILVALLAAGGLGLKRSGLAEPLEAWLQRQPAAAASRYDFVLPAPLLGGAALLIVVGLSIFGCYVYYPPPAEIFEELRIVNTEVVASTTSRDWDTAAYWIPVHQDWIRKVQVSSYLRGRGLTRYQRAKADVVLERLELLEHEIEARRAEEANRLARALHQAYRRLRAAYGDIELVEVSWVSILAYDIAGRTCAQGVVDRQVDRLGDQMHGTVGGQEIRAGRVEAAEVVKVMSRRVDRVRRVAGDSGDSRHPVLASSHDANPSGRSKFRVAFADDQRGAQAVQDVRKTKLPVQHEHAVAFAAVEGG